MSRTKNRRQANSEPLPRKKTQSTRRRRKTKSLSNRHRQKKNTKNKDTKSNIYEIKRLTQSIISQLDEIDEDGTKIKDIIKSVIDKNKKIDLNNIEKALSRFNDELIDKIQDIRGEEGLVDGRDFNTEFDAELYANYDR